MNVNVLRKVRTIALAALLFGGIAPSFANAQKAEAKIQRLINSDFNGVQSIKKAPNGEIKSLVVIGRAPLNRSLPQALARRTAFRSAQAQARAQYVQWMKTQMSMTYSEKQGVKVFTKGEAAGDTGEASSLEKSETTLLTEEQISERASGFVAGLSEIGTGVYEGSAVVIYGWSAATTKAIDRVANLMDRKDQSGTGLGAEAVRRADEAKRVDEERQSGNHKGNNSPVQNRHSVSDDAAEFF